jgi:hypothetical protein
MATTVDYREPPAIGGQSGASAMSKTATILISTVLFSLVGLGVGFVAISNLTPLRPGSTGLSADTRDFYVIVLAICPTMAGGVLGLIVGAIASMLGSRLDDRR